MRNKKSIDSQTAALICVRAALEKHAEAAVVIDLRLLSSVADYFVICSANSARQIRAIKENIEVALCERGCSVWHTEGLITEEGKAGAFGETPQWVLMDCGDFVVHLFDQRSRDFYRLEDLWADAPRIPLGTLPA